jgi:hypothetical protein
MANYIKRSTGFLGGTRVKLFVQTVRKKDCWETKAFVNNSKGKALLVGKRFQSEEEAIAYHDRIEVILEETPR